MIFLQLAYFLAAFCLVGGILAVIDEARRFKRTRDARRHFVKAMSAKPFSTKLLELRQRLASRGVIDLVELQQLIRLMNDIAQGALQEKERQVVERSLFNESLRIRTVFAERLMDMAGIGVGCRPIVVR